MTKRYLKTIFGQLGLVLIGISMFLLTPSISLLFYPKEYMQMVYFLVPSLISFVLGMLLYTKYKGSAKLKIPKSYQVFVVVFTWIISCLFFTIPFLLKGTLNFTQAFFEITSGISTTGLSVINVEEVDKIFLMYRSLTQYVGGIGIILIIIVLFGTSLGFELYQTEGHTDRIAPNFRRTAKIICIIYTGYIVIGAFLLYLAGMPSFDALNTAMSAVATGGFGVTTNSIADYQSHMINLILVILMLLGSISFFAHYLLFEKKIRQFFKIDEIKVFFIAIVILVSIGWIFTLSGNSQLDFETFGSANPSGLIDNGGIFRPLEIVIFEVVSAISGTGFTIIDYKDALFVNHTFYFVIIIAMMIGGAIGSTAGGIKITRITLLWKSIKWNTKKVYSADNKLIARKINTPMGRKKVSSLDIVFASNYIVLYLVTMVIGTLIFTASGYPLETSLFEFTSALSNVGLTTGITSADLAPYLLWTLSIGMFVGRLEIFVVIAVIAKIIRAVSRKLRFHG